MRLLAAMSVLSSLAWVVLPDWFSNWPQSVGDLPRLIPATALMVIAFVVIYTTTGLEQLLFPRIPVLWLLFIALAAFHFYVMPWVGSPGELIYGAALTGSARFALWLIPPLLLSTPAWYPAYRRRRAAKTTAEPLNRG